LYVRPDLLSRLEPLEPHSVLDAQAPATANGSALPAATARLSAVLPHTWPAWHGSLAAVNFHAAVRRDRIEARIRELLVYARLRFAQLKDVEILTPNAPGTWGGLFSFRSSRIGAHELVARLRDQRIATSAVRWGDGQSAVRASFHIFNTHDEIERLVSALQRAT
jgi:selenocysteine lyase/cysteine desulfurase